MNSLQSQLSSLLSQDDLKLITEQEKNTYELIGVHEHLKVSSGYTHGYNIVSDFEIYLKKDSSFYLVTLGNWFGDCGSGWTSASYGSYTMPQKISSERFKQFHYVPKSKMKVLVQEFEIDDYDYANNFEISDWVTSEVLFFCTGDGDPYYPSGGAGFCKESDKLFFNSTNRYTGKLKVFIVEGKPTIGKTTLFPNGLELEQFNNKKKLTIEFIVDFPVLICGGKWNYDKVVNLLKTDEYYYNNIEIVKVSLS